MKQAVLGWAGSRAHRRRPKHTHTHTQTHTHARARSEEAGVHPGGGVLSGGLACSALMSMAGGIEGGVRAKNSHQHLLPHGGKAVRDKQTDREDTQ